MAKATAAGRPSQWRDFETYAETRKYVTGVANRAAGGDAKFSRASSTAGIDTAELKVKTLGYEEQASALDRLAKEKKVQEEIAKEAEILKNKLVVENEELMLKAASLNQSQLTTELAKIDLTFTKKSIELKKDGNFAGIEYLKILRDQEKVQAVFLDAQRKAGQAAEYFGFAQEAINLKRATGEISELQALDEIQKAKEAQLPMLEDELSKVSAIADEEQRKLETLKLQAQIREIKNPNAGAAEKYFAGKRSEGLAGQVGEVEKTHENRQFSFGQELLKSDSLEEKQKINDAKFASDAQYYGSLMNLSSETFGGITSQMIKMYGVQSKQARLAFAAQKSAAAGAVVMNTATAVMAQLNSPPPMSFIMAGLAAAMGAAQLATVLMQPMPQAHGGADNIPEDATYLLSKGERVLSPNQNQEFMKLNRDNSKYINRTSSTGGRQSGNSSQPTVVKPQIKVINVDYSSQDFDKYLSSNSGEQVIVNHMTRNKESLA